MNNQLPRGLRNNNPLNIKYSPSNNWRGKVLNNTDGEFEQFDNIVNGFRAALYLIRRYINSYGLCSVRTIINRWCPDDTQSSYVNFVCARTGLAPSDLVYFEDKDLMIDLVIAMACFENGIEYVENGIEYGDYTEFYSIVSRAYSLV